MISDFSASSCVRIRLRIRSKTIFFQIYKFSTFFDLQDLWICWFQFSFFWDPEATVRIADSRSGDDFLKSLDFWNRKVLLWSVSGYRITTTHWVNNRTYWHRFKAATSELVAQKSEKGKETQRERISAWNTHTLTFSCWVCSFGYLLVACLLLM